MFRPLRFGFFLALAAVGIAPTASAEDPPTAPDAGAPTAGERARASSVSWANVLASLRTHIARQGKDIDPGKILADQSFREIGRMLGGNSILVERAVAATLAQHRVPITDAELSSVQTPRQLTDRIHHQLSTRAKNAIFDVFRDQVLGRTDQAKAGSVRRDQSFRDISRALGIGSFLIAHIVADTIAQLGVRVTDEELSSLQTPGALVESLHVKLMMRP